MTDDKIKEVLDRYENLADVAPPEQRRWLSMHEEMTRDRAAKKVKSMVPQMREFHRTGRREKLMRWLGFAQGTLWMAGMYSLEDLKNHNRPDSDE